MTDGSATGLAQREAVLPAGIELGSCGPEDATAPEPHDNVPQAISGFICIISYVDANGDASERAIACRRYELVSGAPIVGAICLQSKRYKQFRCDRILTVSDAITGEVLGNGSFFDQFVVGAIREKADTWNITSQRKSIIVAGLNVLSFMARCDGVWHPLEEQTIEDFVCSLWIRKEWEGEPPIEKILAHARRLAPDGEVFCASLRPFAHSNVSRSILTTFVHRVIAADGKICDAEHHWATQFAELLEDAEAIEAGGQQ